MAIETLTKDVEATEITSDDELEVMDIDQVTGRETETENMVGMEVDVGMPSTIVTKSSKQDVLHDDQDNSTHLHGKVEDAIQGWKERYQSLLSEVENERLQKERPSMRHQWQSRLLSQVLEAQMLLGTSVDLMRDCLQKFKADGYEVDPDVLATTTLGAGQNTPGKVLCQYLDSIPKYVSILKKKDFDNILNN